LVGLNEAFIIDEEVKHKTTAQDPKSCEIIKPILRGRDLKKFSYEFNGFYLINTHNGLKQKGLSRVNAEKQYPAIF
jgi:adenine-specific DNA-methyltransferase